MWTEEEMDHMAEDYDSGKLVVEFVEITKEKKGEEK